MKKLIVALVIFLLVGQIYSPVCLAENVDPPNNKEDNAPTTSGGSVTNGGTATTGDSGTNGGTATTGDSGTNGGIATSGDSGTNGGSGTANIEVPNDKLKEGKPNVILIEKKGNNWEYKPDFDDTTINIGWILLVVVAVISLFVNCIIISTRKGR